MDTNKQTWTEQLKQRAEQTEGIVCLGMDPSLEKIPLEGTTEEIITKFYSDILDACEKENCIPAIVKPNIAYFEQYGFDGLKALKNIIKKCRKTGIPVLCDAKRGDIGATSTAYAKALFDFWQFDAITVSPWMGEDSVMPFLEYGKQGKGIYILMRTSNPGTRDFQEQIAEGRKLYMHIAEKLLHWNKEGTCAVIGATGIDELEELARFFVNAQKEVPFLIPGIGKQGGSLEDVVAALRRSGTDIRIHRINASSDINWAWEKEGNPQDYAGAAVRALKRMKEIVGL